MSDQDSTNPERGQASNQDAEGMIEQRTMDQRRKGSPALDEARLRQQAIGVKLRQMFDEVVSEPVPDEFLDILRRADHASGDT
ncbi:MAG TPA: NepR family anti-sigma factor [Caulobacteraceae bacterium]